jgi:hypothetical protein
MQMLSSARFSNDGKGLIAPGKTGTITICSHPYSMEKASTLQGCEFAT